MLKSEINKLHYCLHVHCTVTVLLYENRAVKLLYSHKQYCSSTEGKLTVLEEQMKHCGVCRSDTLSAQMVVTRVFRWNSKLCHNSVVWSNNSNTANQGLTHIIMIVLKTLCHADGYSLSCKTKYTYRVCVCVATPWRTVHLHLVHVFLMMRIAQASHNRKRITTIK